jgi:dihydrofolate synthase/folylpolyglutamate synthase
VELKRFYHIYKSLHILQGFSHNNLPLISLILPWGKKIYNMESRMLESRDKPVGPEDVSEAFAYLETFTNYEREMRYPYDGWAMNLERVRALLEGLSDPLASLKVIHIAGTKGKGSTAAMIESILRKAGYKTGLFTSPHLIRVNERIRVNGREITDLELAEELIQLKPAAKEVDTLGSLGKLTYFEILTALALCFFAKVNVDATVLEVGLGGRFDATNVCDPVCAVITSISLDHTDILGTDLAGIAGEKAMIIKPERPAVIAPQTREVKEVMISRAREVEAEVFWVEDSYAYKRRFMDDKHLCFDLEGKRHLEEASTPMLGDQHMINAATAVTVCDVLEGKGFQIPDAAIREGLASIELPARFQIVRREPRVILDGAHNRDSARHLAGTMRELFPGSRITAVIGLAKDKDVEGFLDEIAPLCGRIIFTRSRTMKAAPEKRLLDAVLEFTGEVIMTEGVGQAVHAALDKAGPEDVILITGSFYVVGEAIEALLDES